MEIILLAILLGLIPAAIAQTKGRSFIVWWIYGALLFIIALPHALIMSSNVKAIEQKQLTEGMRKCPFCAEMVKAEAIVCRYCNRDLPPVVTEHGNISASSDTPSAQNIVSDEDAGLCSRCDTRVRRSAIKCPKCGAPFGPAPAWQIKPLSAQLAPQSGQSQNNW